MTEGGRIPSHLLTLAFHPKAPCLQVAFSPINVPSPPSSLPTDIPWPAGFPRCPVPARGLGTSPHYLGSPLDVLWKGLEGAGQGGAGQALMQSRGAAGQAAALAVGGRRLPLPPPLRPARAQSEQDLVPCSGYCALSAGAASLKQLASKNTLGLGSGRHGRRVCFYTPAPILGFLALGLGAHLIWDGRGVFYSSSG